MAPSSQWFQSFLTSLQTQYPHAGDFCFFADIDNLVRICTLGEMLSRQLAESMGVIASDCAAPLVLNQTPTWVKNYVRLYFAPQTPMLYRVEGIKRIPDGWPQCSRPVYLVFDHHVLGLNGALVSDRSMKESNVVCKQASTNWVKSLPYDEIYHRGPLPGDNPGIIQRRHAEVLIPDRLPLALLREVVFRSQAEHQLAGVLGLSLPASVQVSVDKSWFYADQRQRLYADDWQLQPQHRLKIAHCTAQDTLIALKVTSSGERSIGQAVCNRTATDQLKWTAITRVVTAPPGSWPSPGYIRYFISGVCVAEAPIDAGLPLLEAK